MTKQSQSDAPSGPIGVAILGSTGSIGRQTLQVIADHPDRFRVVALAGGDNEALLASQTARFRPELVALAAPPVSWPPNLPPPIDPGANGLNAVATHPDAEIVVIATSGHAAIIPTVDAIVAGKIIAIANKETIVCAGELIFPLIDAHESEIRPVDSEHSAIWQSLGRSTHDEISRLILTASGGPFLATPLAELATVTRDQALAHPTWSMGGKISIDSATLMNKGLEVIEAHWLFDIAFDDIEVVIHPESIVHSLVEFVDHSQIAQLSLPDMRLPIQYALTFPKHAPSSCKSLNLADIGALHFMPPDPHRFRALSLARSAGIAGNTYPTVLSAADDTAVQSFLDGKVRFRDLTDVVERVLALHQPDEPLSFDAIERSDRWARSAAHEVIEGMRR